MWLENCGAGVTFELLSFLRFLVEKHGVLYTEDLIREMAGSLKTDRMTLNYLRGAYNFKLKGGTQRAQSSKVVPIGGNSSGKGRFDDEPEPDYGWLGEADRVSAEH